MGIFAKQQMLAALMCTASIIGAAEHTCAQGMDDNRILTGSADLDLGRFVVGSNEVRIGEITVSSNEVEPGGIQHSINVAQDGFAILDNGLAIRNTSGQFQFDGAAPSSQSHNLDIFFLDANRTGNFDIQQQGLSGTNQTQAGDQVTTTYGGYWFQQGVYNDDDGNETVIEPAGSNGLSRPSAINSFFNQVDSPEPAPLQNVIRGELSAPLRLVEDESTPAVRINPLFAVEPSAPENAGSLDLSGIDITVSGTPIADRLIFGGLVSLGRSLVGGEDRVIDLEETRVLSTFGSNDERTQLELGGFNLDNGSGVTAVLNTAGPVEFNSAEDTAEVTVTGNFTIVGDQIGTFRQTVDAGTSISSVENLLGEDTQSNLRIGYEYGVVAENEAESDSVTVYKIDDFNTSGEAGRNSTLRRSESTSTHTAIRIGDGRNSSSFSSEETFFDNFTLDGTDLQTVTLNAANGGIRGEGLEGEQVTAETSYDIHTRSIQSSDLLSMSTPEGNVGQEPIEIRNARVVDNSELQAIAFFEGVSRNGSDRWFLDPVGNLNLGAGDVVTLTPTFDEVGLAEEELGRSFRTTFELSFQDGGDFLTFDPVDGTRNARVNVDGNFFSPSIGQGEGRFAIFGSEETRQTFRWVVEQNVAVEATEGTISLAAGTSLRDEGINLTNTADNTTDGFAPSNVAILDGVFSTADGTSADVSLSFENLANASENQVGAEGFDLLSSDIVDVTGLDGILHTIELDYNFDSEEAELLDASLLWFDDEDPEVLDDGAWVNAVLGNSNVTEYDLLEDTVVLAGSDEALNLTEYLDSLQFELSYTDYLFSTETGAPLLGAHGYDVEAGVVWAVIDHNSFFASSAIAVPEPSTMAIMSACGLIGLTRRRRSK